MWLCSGTMQPFLRSTRATMMSRPTTNCLCSSGLRFSSGTVLQGMCRRTALARCLGAPCWRKAPLSPRVEMRGLVRFDPTVFFGPKIFRFPFLLASVFVFRISVHLTGIEFYCVVVQVTVSELERVGLSHLAFGNHFSERGGQSFASGLHSQPVALFGSEYFIVGETIGAEGNFVGKSFEPLFEGVLELGGVHDDLAERRVEVDIFHRGQPDCLALQRITSVNHDERGVGITGVAEKAFQIHDVAFGMV